MPNDVSKLLGKHIRVIKDYPKKGVTFRDITTLLKDPEGYKICVEGFAKRYENRRIDVIVGIESRGFIVSGAVAYLLGVGFVPVRKKGKLPAPIISEKYTLEYGKAEMEIHKDAIKKGQRVIIMDDLIATGGTALAAAKLVERLGGKVEEFAFIVNLPELGGAKRLDNAGYKYHVEASFD